MKHLLKRGINRLLSPMEYCIAHTMEKQLGRPRKIELVPDFVRQSSLELCAHEITTNNVLGNVAELGVYRGDFASKMNKLFPKRKLYLFDTFEGFNSEDVKFDKSLNFSVDEQDFSNTSVQTVLDKMTSPENCIIKKGYFPDTAIDVNDVFSFVSIDADLYKPIYDGLHFFYPKLSKGGYIFVHDFNNKRYLGAREAVVEFCKMNEVGYFPLSDICGTAIILK